MPQLEWNNIKAATEGVRRTTIAEWTVTVLLLLFGTTTLGQAFVIPTGSMEDTLLVGDHVLVDKLVYSPSGSISRHLLPYAEPKHGDIIVFRYPHDLKTMLVKRVIGVPGDRIRITDGALYRNGVKLNEPYVYHKYPNYVAALDNYPWRCCRPVKEDTALLEQDRMLRQNTTNGEIVVPAGHYFGMGDNRDNSSDSRYWGFIPRENIVGKPILIYWSYDTTTEALLGATADSMANHFIDLAQNFFTRTRWNRTFKLIRGVDDSQLPRM